MLQLTTKLMNRFSYSITTNFIPGNKDYHSCCNPHSVGLYFKMTKFYFDINIARVKNIRNLLTCALRAYISNPFYKTFYKKTKK